MILMESARIYPVFTHHAKELRAAARYLVRRMEQRAGNTKPDEKFNALLDRHRLVVRTLVEMEHTREAFVYLTEEERDLVNRVNTWLKDHPENRIA